MLYFDSSALMKLCRVEPESAALRHWLAEHPAAWVTSTLAEVELIRATARADPPALAYVHRVLAECDRLAIDPRVRTEAAALGPTELRSLDAIHLATALEFEAELEALLTYDKRLADAAGSYGLSVYGPS